MEEKNNIFSVFFYVNKSIKNWVKALVKCPIYLLCITVQKDLKVFVVFLIVYKLFVLQWIGTKKKHNQKRDNICMKKFQENHK